MIHISDMKLFSKPEEKKQIMARPAKIVESVVEDNYSELSVLGMGSQKSGKMTYFVIIQTVGEKTGRIQDWTHLVAANGNIQYKSKALAQAFIDGYNYRVDESSNE